MTQTSNRPPSAGGPASGGRPPGAGGRPAGGPPPGLKAPLSWKFSQHPRLFRLVSNIENFVEWGPRGIPKVEGPADLHDILPPGAGAAAIPYYYMAKPVHRMGPLGFLDPTTPARNDKVAKAIPYIRADRIMPWIQANVKDAGVPVRRVLDVATGQGKSAQAYAQLFPEAEVIGIDLAPPGLRDARAQAEKQGLKNVQFWQMDCGDMSYFPTDHFDVVHIAHALHEMPEDYIEKTVRESIRVCRPGGMICVFEWRIPQTEGEWKHREAMVRIRQEPYMLHYSRANFPKLMSELGCEVREVGQESNSCTWVITKGEDSNRLLRETPVTWPKYDL